MIDLPNPDQTPVLDRTKLRAALEQEDFSDDHYLADWAQPDIIEPLLTYKAQWENGPEGMVNTLFIEYLLYVEKKKMV